MKLAYWQSVILCLLVTFGVSAEDSAEDSPDEGETEEEKKPTIVEITEDSDRIDGLFTLFRDRNTGELLWTDGSPGKNILHGQWSSPAYAVLGDQAQVIFTGGDGWVYSFDPEGDGKGNAKLLWKLDGNPKDSKWILGGRGTRNNIIATPVIYDGNE